MLNNYSDWITCSTRKTTLVGDFEDTLETTTKNPILNCRSTSPRSFIIYFIVNEFAKADGI